MSQLIGQKVPVFLLSQVSSFFWLYINQIQCEVNCCNLFFPSGYLVISEGKSYCLFVSLVLYEEPFSFLKKKNTLNITLNPPFLLWVIVLIEFLLLTPKNQITQTLD